MGGFSKGTFSSDMSKLKAKRVPLGGRVLKVWTVASKTLRALEAAKSAPEPSPKSKKKKPAEPVAKKPAAKKSSAKKPAAKKSSGARRARKKPEE